MDDWSLDLGANFLNDGSVRFKVWAPHQSSLHVKLQGKQMKMEKADKGYFQLDVQGVQEKAAYTYVLDQGLERHDPVSRFLPHGTNGATTIIHPHTFAWTDHSWNGIPLEEMIFYECHVGTFTSEGTLRDVQSKLPYLKELGITCLELMPIAQFAGRWGWGYDPQSPYAIHNIYGDPYALKELVNACHANGIAVCLDVVYNHFGPEGCYLGDFGPYWTDRYKTPWGKGINYDDSYSDEVRHFFLQNALYWIVEYHFDALRLDALHALFDNSATPFLVELSAAVEKVAEQQNRKIHLIAESDRNDSRLIRPRKKGGMGLSAWWDEDFHHSWHVAVTKEKTGYFQDFRGLPDLKKTMAKSVVYEGQYSLYRHHSHGNSFKGIAQSQLVAFLQNHDQIGNRPDSARMSNLVSFEAQKMSALLLLLSPYPPLLFMGQEYGEQAPFHYFVDYENPELMASITTNRKKELSITDLPPPDESAYLHSKLKWTLSEPLLTLYRQLIALRKTSLLKPKVTSSKNIWIAWEYPHLACICNFSKEPQQIDLPFKSTPTLLLHTDQKEFLGKETLTLQNNTLSIPPECGAAFHI